MGTCISRGGGQCHTQLLVLGEGGMKVTRYQNVILLTYLRSVFIFIKQYSDSMCFSSIFSLKLRIVPYPDSKWKLGQRWALSCNFRWANVGFAMQNHPHFAHPKNVGPTCCTNVGPTCCTNVGPTCSINVGSTCCINVGQPCWANVGSLLASGSC